MINKKLLNLLTLVLICMIFLSGCGECKHIWDLSNKEEATCTTEGVYTYTCRKCGDTRDEIFTPNGHSEVTDFAKDPTCTEEGLTQGSHCSTCGEVIVPQENIPAKGHIEEIKPGIQATCEEEGLTEGKYCLSCDLVIEEQVKIEKLDHTEVIKEGVPATCYTSGLTEGKYCSTCLKVFSEQTTIEPLPHQFNSENKCSLCGDSKPSEGLNIVIYASYQDNNEFTAVVEGMGSCTDEEVVIPRYYNGVLVTVIGREAFKNNTVIKHINIPNTLTTIENYAFTGCSSLVDVILPEGVISIGDYAFGGCSKLSTISIPNTLVELGNNVIKDCPLLTFNSYQNSDYIGNDTNKYLVLVKGNLDESVSVLNIKPTTKFIYSEAFYKCDALKTLILPEGIISIGECAFAFTSITDVILPTTLITIKSAAFAQCQKLKNIVMPRSVKKLNSDFVYGCDNIQNLYYNGTMEEYLKCKIEGSESDHFMLFFKNFYMKDDNGSEEFQNQKYSLLTEVLVPETITLIGHLQFYNIESIKTLIIPTSIKEIGTYAFSQSNLKVYYKGTEEQMKQIQIGHSNYGIFNAEITYNYN